MYDLSLGLYKIPYGWKFWREDIFGGLLKIRMSFGGIYFAIEPVLAIMIFITKWLIKRALVIYRDVS